MNAHVYHFAARNPIDLVHPFNQNRTIAEKGVVVGCNAAFEWMLKWWWHYYSQHNDYPVAFVNAGMTDEGYQWCLAHGCVLDFSNSCLQGDENDKVFGIEHGWKAFAPLFAPFERIAWIDLDCEITGNIDSIFDYANKLALARDPFFHLTRLGRHLREKRVISEGEQFYNSGVIAVRQASPLLLKWAAHSVNGPVSWRHSDQHILQGLIYQYPDFFDELPEHFNKLAPYKHAGTLHDALILHRLASHPHSLRTIQEQAARLN
jgi:hypothetical protein